MLCEDVMKSDIECVSPQTSIQTAARRMREQNVGFLPVCDEGMKVVGTLTDRDITIRGVADGVPITKSVDLLMTREVVSCFPEADLAHALELMAQHHKSRIMCISRNGRLEGIISLSDIAQLDELSGGDTLRHVSSRESRGYTVAPIS